MSKTPTICFATVCKNEEKNILETLESVYKHIDYWVVCDTGSTDKTREIVLEFFESKNIPGDLYIDDWKGFAHNKSLMLERCYKKTDYILHIDADDLFVGNIDKNLLASNNAINFFITYTRGSFRYSYENFYNNSYKWVAVGAAHTRFFCTDSYKHCLPGNFRNESFHVVSRGIGDRSNDVNKFLKDAENLKQDYFNTLIHDPYDINYRSVFYIAQSYYDSKYYVDAMKWYSIFTKLKNVWVEEEFESYLRITKCMILLNYSAIEVVKTAQNAIKIFPNRAEPYFVLGEYFCKQNNYELGYYNYRKAKEMDYDTVSKKYDLFIDINMYGIHINYSLALCCLHTNNLAEAVSLLQVVINETKIEVCNKEKSTELYNLITKMLEKQII